ncbi:MAG: glutathione synthase [Deltaproteobacteria bacterium]|nr:glutathione synthase [Deltaproteobacteria bacterium]MBW2395204.1 glutathione synthase [Deltaproteobacteria bacterium]
MAFVMDPLEAIDIEGDTTFVLMLAAQERGHGLWYVDPADLGVDARGAVATARPVTLRREQGNHASVGEPSHVALDEAFDVVWQRKDPPVDGEFIVATQILGLCSKALVLNRPAGILAANEKLYALNFPDLMPETLVAHEIPRLLEFLDSLGGEMIVKPLDGRGGEGIFHVTRDDRNLNSILEQSTRFGERRVMAQRYLPDIRIGDKRILLLEGEPLGALLRVPAESEVRANLHVGGKAAPGILDDTDRMIIERVAPWIRRDGLFFVGIDVIGGKLTEINVTSPTGIQEMNAFDGARYEVAVIEAVEAQLA